MRISDWSSDVCSSDLHYGRQPNYSSDPRSAGNWLSGDGLSALLGVRTTSHPRYGLVLLTGRHATSLIRPGSLTACDFREDLAWGIFVEEGLNPAPRFVRVDPQDGRRQAHRPPSPSPDRAQPYAGQHPN